MFLPFSFQKKQISYIVLSEHLSVPGNNLGFFPSLAEVMFLLFLEVQSKQFQGRHLRLDFLRLKNNNKKFFLEGGQIVKKIYNLGKKCPEFQENSGFKGCLGPDALSPTCVPGCGSICIPLKLVKCPS